MQNTSPAWALLDRCQPCRCAAGDHALARLYRVGNLLPAACMDRTGPTKPPLTVPPQRPLVAPENVRSRVVQTSEVVRSKPRGHTMSEFTFLFRGSDPSAQSPEQMQKSMQKWLASFNALGRT